MSAENPAEDLQGLVLLREGRMQGLEPIYRRHSGPVYRYLLALGASEESASDALHDAFLSFAQQAQAFDPQRGSLGAYLAGIARHALLAQWRRQGREVSTEADADFGLGDPNAASEPGPLDRLERETSQRALWRAIAMLPFVFREAVLLVDIQERSYVEAASIAGIELNTLRTRLHRARLRLAHMLQNESAIKPEGMPHAGDAHRAEDGQASELNIASGRKSKP
ncbi:MAG: RNA polymerase sigma factor [Betaproteobacteria bacterium]|nr:RNA polymerase sigma factor [Betaproteobacteria bacterium]